MTTRIRTATKGVIIGFLLLVIVLSVNQNSALSDTNTNSDIELTKGFVVASTTTEYKAEAFTDSLGYWTNDANAYDGNWGTFAYQAVAVVADEYPSCYGHTFDSAESGSGTISQVDIIVRVQVTGLSGSSDYWQLTLDVGGSTGNTLSGTQYNLALTNLTYSAVTEPNGGGWSWAEVRSIQIHTDTEKDKGADGGQINIYEYSVRVTYEPPAGDNYYVTVSESLDVSESIDTSVSWSATKSEIIEFAESFYTAVGFGLGLSELITFYDSVVAEILESGDAYFLVVNEFVEFAEAFYTAVGFGLGLSELIAFYDSIATAISEGGFYSLIANEIISFIDSIGTSVSWATGISEIIDFAGSVVVVLNPANIITLIIHEAIQIIELLGEFEEMNIFFELFLSTGIWGLFGPLALVVAGFFITQKEKGLGILFIIVDSIIVYQYLALPNYELYLWHVIILILGIMQCTFQLFSKRR